MKRILATVLAAVMCVGVLAGCGKTESTKGGTDKNAGGANQEATTYDEMPSELTVEEVGSVDIEGSLSFASGGMYYRATNGKYGILNLDGSKDTGAIYASCEDAYDYFIVSRNAEIDADNIETVNRNGLVDGEGNVLIPFQYAVIESLSDRYVKVCEAKARSYNEDECLVFLSKGLAAAIVPGEEDPMYTGMWYIIDITTGQKVPGATGTKGYGAEAYGGCLTYTTDDGVRHKLDAKGNELPEDANLFSSGKYAGCYSLVGDNEGAIYSDEGEKLFAYDLAGYRPWSSRGNYFIASKSADSGTTYVVMDGTGEIVSAEFSVQISLYGDLIHGEDKKVYNFEGEQIVEGTYETVYLDETYQNYWMLKDNDDLTLIEEDGTVIYQGRGSFSSDKFNIYRQMNGEYQSFSIKDKDFTIEGLFFGPYLADVRAANYVHSAVDVISGNTLLEGYRNYYYKDGSDGNNYIYADKEEGGFDIYTVK